MQLLVNQVVKRRIATMAFMLDLTNTDFCTANANSRSHFWERTIWRWKTNVSGGIVPNLYSRSRTHRIAKCCSSKAPRKSIFCLILARYVLTVATPTFREEHRRYAY